VLAKNSFSHATANGKAPTARVVTERELKHRRGHAVHDRMPAMSPESVLDPRCIAVVGASDDPDKIGARPFVHLARNGYAGRILAVNPTRTEMQGSPSFPDVASLPEVPEEGRTTDGGHR
jgi:CoA binding domain